MKPERTLRNVKIDLQKSQRSLFLFHIEILFWFMLSLVGNFFVYKLEQYLVGYSTLVNKPFYDGYLIALAPSGSFLLVYIYFVLELVYLPFDKTSIFRVFIKRDCSAKRDLFYFLISCSGLRVFYAFALTLGVPFYVKSFIDGAQGLGLLSDLPYGISVFLLFFLHTFTYYWTHRLMHTRWFWELHKVHHSAKHFNSVTPLRNHPLDFSLDIVMQSLIGFVVGARIECVITVLILGGIYQVAAHSHLRWDFSRFKLGFLHDYVFLSSQHHLIHHSDKPEHYNKNIGIIQLWDRVFGTYHPPANEKEEINLGDGVGDLLNSDGLFIGVFKVYVRWLQSIKVNFVGDRKN